MSSSPNHGSQETGGWGGKKEEGIKKSSKGKINRDCHEDFDKCSKGWRTGFGLVIFWW